MTKRVNTIFCWILAISLVWLPLLVSADVSPFSTDNDSCHEMNSTMPMSQSGFDMSGQAAAFDDSMTGSSIHESMKQKGCCDNCDNDCVSCAGMTSCGHSSNHVSAFILFNQYSSELHPLIQFSFLQVVQYHNQIITPDIRPPIV